MSVDARVSKDLVETLRDDQAGFAKAAERLTESESPEESAAKLIALLEERQLIPAAQPA